MRLLQRIRTLEHTHASALTRCRLCGGGDPGHPRVVMRRNDQPLDRCPACDHCINHDGTVLPAVFTSVRLGVRGFTRMSDRGCPSMIPDIRATS